MTNNKVNVTFSSFGSPASSKGINVGTRADGFVRFNSSAFQWYHHSFPVPVTFFPSFLCSHPWYQKERRRWDEFKSWQVRKCKRVRRNTMNKLTNAWIGCRRRNSLGAWDLKERWMKMNRRPKKKYHNSTTPEDRRKWKTDAPQPIRTRPIRRDAPGLLLRDVRRDKTMHWEIEALALLLFRRGLPSGWSEVAVGWRLGGCLSFGGDGNRNRNNTTRGVLCCMLLWTVERSQNSFCAFGLPKCTKKTNGRSPNANGFSPNAQTQIPKRTICFHPKVPRSKFCVILQMHKCN